MAVALPRIPVTAYPISQLFNDMSEALPCYLQSADETFGIVEVNKLNAEGVPRTIRRENLATGKIEVLGPRFSYIENKRTGQLYLKEPAYITAFKCALIFLASPLYTLTTMVWNVYQIYRSVTLIAYNVYREASTDFVLGRYFEATMTMNRHIQPFPEIIKERLYEIIKAPLYGILMQVAAISAVINPYLARDMVSRIDMSWHHGATYRDARSRGDDRSCWEEMHSGKEMFLANCFLPRGNINDVQPRMLASVNNFYIQTDGVQRCFRVLSRHPLEPFFG